MIKDATFVNSVNDIETSAWNFFVKVDQSLVGSNKTDSYKELMDDMLNKLRNTGDNISIKIHDLHSYLDNFPENLADLNK